LLIASHLRYLIKYLVVFMTVVHTYFYLREKLTGVLSQSRISPHLVELEGSLPHSQEPANYLYPEPDQFSACLCIPLLEDPF